MACKYTKGAAGKSPWAIGNHQHSLDMVSWQEAMVDGSTIYREICLLLRVPGLADRARYMRE
jgi:hypothetical protein